MSEELIKCPYCHEADFDLIGLKTHLHHGDCEAFNLTETRQRLFASTTEDQMRELLVKAEEKLGCGCGIDGPCRECSEISYKINTLLSGNAQRPQGGPCEEKGV